MPAGPLKLAAAPVASVDPGVPAVPANVVTAVVRESAFHWTVPPIKVYTVKLDGEVALDPFPSATVIGPEVAPAGTVVTIWVEVELVTTAVVPLNLTTLPAGLVLKLVPVMVTFVPGNP
jgi:hypothetical protein